MLDLVVTRRGSRKLVVTLIGVTIVLIAAIKGWGQVASQRSKSSGTGPRIPGAVSKAPSWIGKNSPFDVAKYFEAVPYDRNAAPLYLDALFEFSPDVEICFPHGPDRSRRSQLAKDRQKQYSTLVQPSNADPNAELDAAATDSVIALFDTGYRKLADAQHKPLCVFETGFGATALLPHVQVSRSVCRISSLRAQLRSPAR